MDRLVALIVQSKSNTNPFVVGITGMDTSGKSQMTDSLARELKRSGEHVQVVHVDDFHQPRALRYRDDLPEPDQYHQYSFDFGKLMRQLCSIA